MVEVRCSVFCSGPEPLYSGSPGIDRDPGATRALRGEPGAIPGETAPLDKALEKPHTRVAEVPQGTPGVPQRQQQRAGREANVPGGDDTGGAQ